MTLRSKVASSRWARAAALPGRAKLVGSHVGREVAAASSWLATSREHHNFTYHLTPRNVEHLAWWASAVTDAAIADCRIWIAEALSDDQLTDHVSRAYRESNRRGLADLEVRIGRRAGWYAVIRALEPEHVVETGTDKGLGAVVIASALLRNGHGRLTTIDINPESGYLIAGPYAAVTSLVIGDSIASIRALGSDVGVFVHDSDHSAKHEMQELITLRGHLAPEARILSDNSHSTDSLVDWASAEGMRFLYFKEEPQNHWYPGGGIGAAWSLNPDEPF